MQLEVAMTRMLKVAMAATALLVLLIGATPVAASDGRAFAECVVHHSTAEGGFTGDHNPGMNQGLAGWSGCPDA